MKQNTQVRFAKYSAPNANPSALQTVPQQKVSPILQVSFIQHVAYCSRHFYLEASFLTLALYNNSLVTFQLVTRFIKL